MQAIEDGAMALCVTETTMQDWVAATMVLRTGGTCASPSLPGALAPHPRPPRPEILPARALRQPASRAAAPATYRCSVFLKILPSFMMTTKLR